MAQHDGSTVVEAEKMEGVLADVDAKSGDGGGRRALGYGYADHGVGSLLLFPPQREIGRPSNLRAAYGGR